MVARGLFLQRTVKRGTPSEIRLKRVAYWIPSSTAPLVGTARLPTKSRSLVLPFRQLYYSYTNSGSAGRVVEEPCRTTQALLK